MITALHVVAGAERILVEYHGDQPLLSTLQRDEPTVGLGKKTSRLGVIEKCHRANDLVLLQLEEELDAGCMPIPWERVIKEDTDAEGDDDEDKSPAKAKQTFFGMEPGDHLVAYGFGTSRLSFDDGRQKVVAHTLLDRTLSIRETGHSLRRMIDGLGYAGWFEQAGILHGGDATVMSLDGQLTPGYSGAPLFHGDRFVAIGSGGVEDGSTHISWAIPATRISHLMEAESFPDPPVLNDDLVAAIRDARGSRQAAFSGVMHETVSSSQVAVGPGKTSRKATVAPSVARTSGLDDSWRPPLDTTHRLYSRVEDALALVSKSSRQRPKEQFELLDEARDEFRKVARAAEALGPLWLYATFIEGECNRRIGTLDIVRGGIGDTKKPLKRYKDAIECYERVDEALLDYWDDDHRSLKAASLFYRAELHLCIAAGYWDRYEKYMAKQRAKNRRGHSTDHASAKDHFEEAEVAWLALVHDYPGAKSKDGESWDARLQELADQLAEKGMKF